MKILKKISIGSINGVRGGFNAMSLFGLRPNPTDPNAAPVGDRTSVTVMTVIGLVNGYTEKTSETMGVSYAFKGEFQAINKDGEKCIAPVCFLPEPAQSLIKTACDEGATAIEIGFVVDAIRSDDALKGYEFNLKSLQEPKASTALDHLSARLLSHDAPAAAPVSQGVESAFEPVPTETKPHSKKK